ncbi:Probable pectinesterase 67 [Linum grandiflorum]
MASFSPTSMTKFHLVMSTTSTVALLVAALWISSTHHQLANAEATDKVIDAPLLTSKVAANRTIMVDINGGGDYKSIQAAIDAVPFMNPQWVIIHIRKGEYREKVRIPPNKPYIFFRGNGKGKTHIVWSQSATDNLDSATFRLESPNFIAFGISFKNDAPVGEAFTSQNQSVAAFVGHDRAAFYHCAFYSNHNTLHDYKGRHYYDHCYIQGSIDFIFGRARSIFQGAHPRIDHGAAQGRSRR